MATRATAAPNAAQSPFQSDKPAFTGPSPLGTAPIGTQGLCTDVPQEVLSETLRSTKRGFYSVFAMSFMLNLLMLVSPIYMMQVFDRVLSSGRVETLIMLTIIAAGAILVLGQLETLRQRVLTRVGFWMDGRLAIPLLSCSVQEAARTHRPSGEAMRDLSRLRSFFGSQSILPFLDSPWVPFYVLIIFLLHPLMGLVALAGAVVLFALAVVSEFATREPQAEAHGKQAAAFQQAESATRNAEVVQAMGMLDAVLERWAGHNKQAVDKHLKAADFAAMITGHIKAIRLLVQIAILGLGAYLVLQGALTAGGMIAASILLGRGLAPVEQSVGAWRSMIGARNAYDRVAKLLRDGDAEPAKLMLSRPEGHVTIEGLTYQPEGAKEPVLEDIAFELEPGESIAVVGPSASGKSTLCRLIVGVLRPTKGAVRLDGAEVWTWPRAQLGRHVGYLPQQVALFEGTVAENIARMGSPKAERVIEAAKKADVHDMILRLPEGYNTPIGDVGPFLSGGQRQRLGLARALYGQPCLLVLDEPNSNLDQEGEAALLRTIDALREDGTSVVMVAHRMGVISHVDKLLILHEGRVRMLGPCNEVIAERMEAHRAAKGAAAGVQA